MYMFILLLRHVSTSSTNTSTILVQPIYIYIYILAIPEHHHLQCTCSHGCSPAVTICSPAVTVCRAAEPFAVEAGRRSSPRSGGTVAPRPYPSVHPCAPQAKRQLRISSQPPQESRCCLRLPCSESVLRQLPVGSDTSAQPP